MNDTPAEPRLETLLQWFRSWVTPEGAIHGFHNHSVWGTNPASFLDFTSDHAAFSAPALGGLSELVARHPDPRATELLRQLVVYQSTSLQPDGQYAHVGFQVGESATTGLIHNSTASIGVLDALVHSPELLTADEKKNVLEVVLRNLEALKMYGDGRPEEGGTCNQEYARVWVKLLYGIVSGDTRFDTELPDDLDFLIDRFHKAGIPDAQSSGAYRVAIERHDGGILEPAEYYGLLIAPLIIASERYGESRYLDEAVRLARHVVRSAWRDENGATRFHRYWYVSPSRTVKSDTPMLIAGMGMTLYGMSHVLDRVDDPEIAEFVASCLRTYASYQVPAGYFVAASGWHNEADVAPSTAWHAHDVLFFGHRLGKQGVDWDAVFAEPERQSVLVSDRAVWSEHGDHWAIRSPYTAGDLALFGRKSRNTFAREFYEWTDMEPLPAEFAYPHAPMFFVSNDGIYRKDDDATPTDVTVTGPLPFRGAL